MRKSAQKSIVFFGWAMHRTYGTLWLGHRDRAGECRRGRHAFDGDIQCRCDNLFVGEVLPDAVRRKHEHKVTGG